MAGAILSIQSAVSYGHVGNSAATFPLQRLGAEVWPINTVQFSNHPGYGARTGQVFTGAQVQDLVDGLVARGVLAGCDAVLSGYLGDAAVAVAVLHAVSMVRAANPAALYCCDPVIGDDGPGIYVQPALPALFRRALPARFRPRHPQPVRAAAPHRPPCCHGGGRQSRRRRPARHHAARRLRPHHQPARGRHPPLAASTCSPKTPMRVGDCARRCCQRLPTAPATPSRRSSCCTACAPGRQRPRWRLPPAPSSACFAAPPRQARASCSR